MIKARTHAERELCHLDSLLRAVKQEVRNYFQSVYDNGQLAALDRRLSEAGYSTPFSQLIPDFDGADALGLYHHIRARFGLSESHQSQFRPRQSELHTYTLGQAVDALSKTAQLLTD